MQVRYGPEADILLLTLWNDPPVKAIEEPGGVIVSYGEAGEPVSIEFFHASARHLVEDGRLSIALQAGPPA